METSISWPSDYMVPGLFTETDTLYVAPDPEPDKATVMGYAGINQEMKHKPKSHKERGFYVDRSLAHQMGA